MDRTDDTKEIMLGARREWLRRAHVMIENPPKSRDTWLRERRDLDEIAIRARLHSPALFQVIPDFFLALRGDKPFHEEVKELEREMARLEKLYLANSADGQQRERRGKRKQKPPSSHDEKVLTVIRSHPTLKGLAYCRVLARADVEPPMPWIKKGCPRSYENAYKKRPTFDDPIDWKAYIRREKSRLSKRLQKHLETKSSTISRTRITRDESEFL
jgi:hypothetical protein